MLVLSRKEGEKIVINLDNDEIIEIEFLEQCRGKIRLGITAPRRIPVFRKELLERVNDDVQRNHGD